MVMVNDYSNRPRGIDVILVVIHRADCPQIPITWEQLGYWLRFPSVEDAEDAYPPGRAFTHRDCLPGQGTHIPASTVGMDASMFDTPI